MAISIKTDLYKRTHGTTPKGRAAWGFILETYDPKTGSKGTFEFFVAGPVTFRDACAVARDKARRMGYQDATIHAAP